jgi:hypothetical protein
MISVEASMPRPVPGGAIVFTWSQCGSHHAVVETGFASLAATEEEQGIAVKENTEGWIAELGELREYAERPAA